MKILKKSLVMFLTLVILLSTACSRNTSWVYEYNGSRISAGMYVNYMISAISNMQSEDLIAHENEEDYALPEQKEYLKASTNGISNSQLVKENAALLCAEYFAVNIRFDELGLTLTDGEISSITAYADSIMSSYAKYFEANGIGRDSIVEFQLNELKRSKIFTALYSAGGELEVSEQELKDKFNTDFAKVEISYYMEPAAEDDAEDQGQNAEFKQEVENIFKRYEAGEQLATLDYELRKVIADEEAEETVEPSEAESFIRIIDISGEIEDDVILNAVINASTGKPTLIYDNSIYYIFTRLDILEDPAHLDEYRETVLIGLKSDEYDEYIKNLAGAITITSNPASISRYTPEKIKANVE